MGSLAKRSVYLLPNRSHGGVVIQATAARAWQLVLLSAPDYRTLDPLVRAKHVLLTLLAAMLMAACEARHGFRARPRALAETLKAAHTAAGVRCSRVWGWWSL